MEAKKLLSSGCEGYLVHIVDTTKTDKLQPKDVPIVQDFLEVFPEELPRLPLEREISFEIKLLPGTVPISKAPYKMAPAELKELKNATARINGQRIYPTKLFTLGSPYIVCKKERWHIKNVY